MQLDKDVVVDYAKGGVDVGTMWDVYRHFWKPFGKLLTDMEAAGMAVNRWAEERAGQHQATLQHAAGSHNCCIKCSVLRLLLTLLVCAHKKGAMPSMRQPYSSRDPMPLFLQRAHAAQQQAQSDQEEAES